jgi:pimeloyl-ACP methyl ester carboxylesterase
MDTLQYEHSGTSRSCCLVVFLPGRRDSAVQYERAQFIDAVRQSGVAVDMVAVEAHYGYYASRTVVVRLREDVIAPAIAQGYEQIWLVGVSMGGLGALLYIREYPRDIAGVVALAPFLGDDDMVQEITKAGGLWQWHIPTVSPGDFPHELWQWLKVYLQRPGEAPRLYLGYGQQDRFAPANDLLAMYLPKTQVLKTPGGHEWSTWRALWKTFLKTTVSLQVSP